MHNILVLGGSGFVGSNLCNHLSSKNESFNLLHPNRSELNLLDFNAVNEYMATNQIDSIVHAAGLVGGLFANDKYPADFCRENLLLGTNIIEAAKINDIKDIILLVGSCSYPNNATNPIKEHDLWNGYPQETSAPYALAKSVISELGYAYNKQYGLNCKVLIPGNIYGEYDNFCLENSHVVPALIRKFHEAKLNKEKELLMWGSGNAVRDFLYIGDLAKIIEEAISLPSISSPVNITASAGITIKELAETVNEITKANLILDWDTSKSDGQMLKKLDNFKMVETFGNYQFTSLRDGISNTYEWFLNSDHLRL